jgi:acylphosphatase
MALLRIHVLITGQVQGVGFRLATAQYATQLGLNGWVQNLPDGRVEAVFEGDRATVEAMVQWCHQGPPTATVAAVTAIAEPPQGLEGFRLRRRG